MADKKKQADEESLLKETKEIQEYI